MYETLKISVKPSFWLNCFPMFFYCSLLEAPQRREIKRYGYREHVQWPTLLLPEPGPTPPSTLLAFIWNVLIICCTVGRFWLYSVCFARYKRVYPVLPFTKKIAVPLSGICVDRLLLTVLILIPLKLISRYSVRSYVQKKQIRNSWELVCLGQSNRAAKTTFVEP